MTLPIVGPIFDKIHAFLGWISDHAALVFMGGILLAAIIALFFFMRWWLSRPPRRDAVKRCIKSLRRVSQNSPQRGKELWTTGNADVPRRRWGVITGSSETASLVYLRARPARGLLKHFQTHDYLIAKHLIPDLYGNRFDIQALGIGQHGPIRWPDDDLHSDEVKVPWEDLLHEAGFDDKDEESLVGRIVRWYIHAFRFMIASQETFDAIDYEAWNWKISMATSIQDTSLPFHNEGRTAASEARNGNNGNGKEESVRVG